mmetsp:Transcript_5692/g.14035  ORF Transcript_5692/g.14035 Transcript_5692/m.14035 type:complete len:87 (-) Transcript_5692:28-288(-)
MRASFGIIPLHTGLETCHLPSNAKLHAWHIGCQHQRATGSSLGAKVLSSYGAQESMHTAHASSPPPSPRHERHPDVLRSLRICSFQ